MDCRKYLRSKFGSGLVGAQITWNLLPAGNLGVSLSLANSLRPLFSVVFFFFFFLCCSALYLWLIISHKHSPPTHTHTRCKHKRSQYVGCNEYVTWRPDSRSLCFLVWLMWQQSLTFFFFFVQKCESVNVCARATCMWGKHHFVPLCLPFLAFSFSSSAASRKCQRRGLLPTSHPISVVYYWSHLTPPTFSEPPYEYQSHQRTLYLI